MLPCCCPAEPAGKQMTKLVEWVAPSGEPFDAVQLSSEREQMAVVLLEGCQVVSYQMRGQEKLFVASASEDVPLRGGIALVLSQLPQRYPLCSPFRLDASGEGWARLSRPPGSSGLDSSLSVTFNLGPDSLPALSIRTVSTPSDLSAPSPSGSNRYEHVLFHAYLRTNDCTNTQVCGLASSILEHDGSNSSNSVTFSSNKEVDQMHTGVSWPVSLVENGVDSIRVHSSEPHCLVWQPGAEKAKDAADLSADEFSRFVCIEPGFVVANAGKSDSTAWATFAPA